MKINRLLRSLAIILLLILLHGKSLAQSVATPLLIVPDKQTYGDFLMSTWKDGAPTLVAFKDPLCGYCIKALKQRARLENYNVFLFWSPILSDSSKQKVAGFFRCEKPVTEEILEAVILRKNPDCNGAEKTQLRRLNDQMTARYQPDFVPQYWFGGQRQTFAQLKLSQSSLDIVKQIKSLSSVKIPWLRYTDFALNQTVTNDKANIALVLPAKMRLPDDVISSMKNDRSLNWFLLSAHTSSNKRDMEFRMLNNIQPAEQPQFILEGKLLSEEEQKRVITGKLRGLLASSSS